MKTKILIIEDDPHILLGLEEILRGEGHEVHTRASGGEASDAVKRVQPDLIVLDVMLPGRSGYDVCRDLRARKIGTPILMLTAKGQEIDKVIGLDLGADDYVTKPFGVRELVARINALLRRGRNSKITSDEPFRIGPALINPRTFELTRGRQTEPLTAKELKLLELFRARAGEVLSRDLLLNEVWGCNYFGTTRTLDQTIAQLRRKLGESSPPRFLITVHGVGYKLTADA